MAEQAETRAEAEGKDEEGNARFWLAELTAAGKREENWRTRGRAVVQRFRDERDRADYSSKERRFNILFANTTLLKAALFQKLGNPDVRRRFPKKGQDERVTKTAALVLERGASYINDVYECDNVVRDVIEDMLLPGRGVAWVVYDAEIGVNPETGQEEIIGQTLKDEHVYWEDYRTSAGRKESDIWWKARSHYFTRDKLKEYFGEEGAKVPLNVTQADAPKDDSRKDDDTFKRARVWEIWDQSKKERIYVAEDHPNILKRDADPYKLTGFYPCPPALYGAKTTSSLVPIPEFTLYQDKADELDDISTRLAVMINSMKRRGVYDAGADGNDNTLAALATADDNTFLPFRNWADLMDKGGLKNAFQTEDLQPTVAVIKGLYERAQFLIQEIYELTGISDVLRGSSNASETATAQQIKANFGSMRLQARQTEVQNFIRHLIRIKAEILAEHFAREQLQEMTGIEMPLEAEKVVLQQQMQALQMQAQQAQAMGGQPPQIPPEQMKQMQEKLKQPTWEEISAILRSDQRRGYKIDVETDQTSQVDDQAEKASRIEFMSTIQAMMEKALPLAMQLPAMRPLVKESIMFVVKAYKAGRPLEEAFDEAFTQIDQMQPPQDQGDPIAQAKAKEIEAKTQATIQAANISAQKSQLEGQIKQRESDANMAGKVIDLQAKQAEIAQKQDLARVEAQMKMRRDAHEFGREVEKADMERAMADANARLAEHSAAIQQASELEDLRAKRAQRMT